MRKEKIQQGLHTYYLRYCEDWLDFIKHAERVNSEASGQRFNGMDCSSLTEGNRRWYGTDSLEEAIRLSYTGWREGREKLQNLSDRLEINSLFLNTRRIKAQYDVEGDEPDIDLYLLNCPENMATQVECIQPRHGKVFHFVINRSASCEVAAETLVRRGAALLLVFKTAILLGYSVEVTLTEAVDDHAGDQYEISIPILHSGDPINIDTLAFMFMHPAVLRRLLFALAECEERVIRDKFGFKCSGGYGQPSDIQILTKGDVYIGVNDGLLRSDDEIEPYSMKVLESMGITPN